MMSRIADVLERESQSVDLEQGDFERLLARRDRKQRDRRIRAGALGALVALATGLVLARSLTSDQVPPDRTANPRPAPAALGSLAYALDGDIYVADADGSNAVKIANGGSAGECGGVGEYWAEGPMWSPDGRYLAFRYSDCSSATFEWGGVVITDAEGNVVATFPTEAGWEIAWSPDSTRVAVWDGWFETIGVYGLDGARQRQLTMPPEWTPSGDHDPAWMPNGTSLLVENVELPLDGGTPRQLRLPGDLEDFSPDGSLVAYITHRSLTVARSDGSEPREVLGEWAGSLTWSPTGDRIAFTTRAPGDASITNELRVIDVATGSVTLLTEAERGSSLRVIGFSPQGDRILFSKTEDRGANSLWSIGVDGSDARLVVTGTISGDWLIR
jgi:Tol biopolymer transport system component